MENTMLKYISICAALVTLGTGSLHAQHAQHAQQGQQEASLQKVEVPGAGFDILLAMPKSPADATINFGNAPDALVIYLIGGELALPFDNAEKMLQAIDSLRLPAGNFSLKNKDGKSSKPVAVYIVPNNKTVSSLQN
jgi:hypothetical protein